MNRYVFELSNYRPDVEMKSLKLSLKFPFKLEGNKVYIEDNRDKEWLIIGGRLFERVYNVT